MEGEPVGRGIIFRESDFPSSCCSNATRNLSQLRDNCIVSDVLWRKMKHKLTIFSNAGVCVGRFERIIGLPKKLYSVVTFFSQVQGFPK